MNVIVLNYRDGTINKVINLPDNISDAKIEEILKEKFKMNDCSWMSYDDPSTYFYHFNNPNSCTVEELQQACEFPSHKFKSLDELPKDSMKIICGSFYMLNEVVTESLVLQSFLQEGS